MAERAPYHPAERSAAELKRPSELAQSAPTARPLIAPQPADCPATRTHAAAAASGCVHRPRERYAGSCSPQGPPRSLSPALPGAYRTTDPGVRGRRVRPERAGLAGPAQAAGLGSAAGGVPWGWCGPSCRFLSHWGPQQTSFSSGEGAPVGSGCV